MSHENQFLLNGVSYGKQVEDFWSWSYSELLLNRIRGDLAEYIVALALKEEVEKTDAWSSYDLLYKKSIKIEIKSAAYIQSWAQSKNTNIVFNIAPKKEWNYITKKMGHEVKRHADFYVFSLLSNKDSSTLNPLDMDQWDFYLCSTDFINNNFKKQKSINLNVLKRNIESVKFEKIQNFFA